MEYSDIMNSLKEIEKEFDNIEDYILSEYLKLDDIAFLLKKENTNFNIIESTLKKIKRKITNKINPIKNNYNEYQLLKIYPYYYLNQKQKEKIYRNINKIIKEDNQDILEDVFFFLLFENKTKKLMEVFKILAKSKNLKVLNIMKKYFIFKNHIVNYKKTKLLIDKITKI